MIKRQPGPDREAHRLPCGPSSSNHGRGLLRLGWKPAIYRAIKRLVDDPAKTPRYRGIEIFSLHQAVSLFGAERVHACAEHARMLSRERGVLRGRRPGAGSPGGCAASGLDGGDPGDGALTDPGSDSSSPPSPRSTFLYFSGNW